MNDNIYHPAHYTAYKPEVIEITRHLPFCLGNVVKYVLRAPLKSGVQDLKKALQYLDWCDSPVVMLPREAQSLLCVLDELTVFLRISIIPYGIWMEKFIVRLGDVLYAGAPFEVLRPIIMGLLADMSAAVSCANV